MAVATRTVRVRFDGTIDGLTRATKAGARAVDQFARQVQKSAAKMDLGGGLLDALGSLPSVLKGAAIVAGAAIGTVMAPAAAAALIAGLLLAIGGGALAAGIASAAGNPKVVAAWSAFGRQAELTFKRFGKPFADPLARAATTFTNALKRAEPTILAIGKAIAPVIDKLAPALATMAEAALPGILAAVQASVPLFDLLALHAPGLGAAVAQFITHLVEGLPGALQFMQGLLTVVELLLPKVGLVVAGLALLGPKIGELRDKLGGILAIAKQRVTAFWTEHIQPRVEKFIPLVERLGTVVAGIAERVLPAVQAAFGTVVQAVKDNETQIDKFLDAVRAVAAFIIDKVLPLLGPILSGVIQALGLVISLVIRQFGMWVDAIAGAIFWGGKLVEWGRRLPEQLRGFFSGLADTISAPFRAAFNAVSRAWNNTVGKLSWTVPSWVPYIGGRTISAPQLPTFHRGGIVPGSGEQLVLAKGGEGVFTPEQMRALGDRGDVEVHVYLDGQQLRGIVRTEIRESHRGLRRLVTAGAGAR